MRPSEYDHLIERFGDFLTGAWVTVAAITLLYLVTR